MRRKNPSHDALALAIGASVIFSQALPIFPHVVAYATEQTEQKSAKVDKQELYALWDGVLDAMDAESLARAELNNAQSKATETDEQMSELQAEMEAGKKEKESLKTNIDELVDFAKNPNPGNRAYADAIMDVVESITGLTDAQDKLGEAKADYASARQRLADLNAELNESDDGEALSEAEGSLDAAKAELEAKTGLQEEAQRKLDEAKASLEESLEKVDGASKASYEKAQEAVKDSETALDDATKLTGDLEAQVAEDERKLAEQGDTAVPYKVTDLVTPGEYMDGIDRKSVV